MSSSGIKRALFAAIVSASTSVGIAADSPPVLREPVLGLRYQASSVRFDRLPAGAITKCGTLFGDQDGTAVWYVYASTRDTSGKTYYIIGGYETRRDVPPYLKFETGGLGVVFSVDEKSCNIIDSARQVFDDRLFNDELPRHVLVQLANDLAQRLTRAFGGSKQLRTELSNQYVDLEPLPPELAESFRPFLGPVRSGKTR